MKMLYVFGYVFLLAACSPKNLSVKWKDSGILSGQVYSSSGSSSVSNQSTNSNATSTIGQTAQKLSATSNQKSISILDTCTNPTVSLFEVGTDGQKTGAAVGISKVENDGTYKIKLPFRKLPSEKTYVVEVSGCTENLSRVVTEQSQQDISVGTSLLSSWLPNSDVADRIVTADKSVLKSLLSAVRDSDSYTLAYSTILNNSVLNADFQRVFGVSPTTLRNVAPEKTDLVAPQVMTEGAATTLSMIVKHWSPEYQFAYKWMVDDVVIGTTANVSFIPHGNMQGAHTLKVFYGAKNIAGELDLTKPYKQKSIAINILNAQPAIVPAVSLTSGALVNSSTLHIALDTGAMRSHCVSFSRIAIKEDVPTSPLLESEFQYTCDIAGTQDLVYNLSGADGAHTLYIWTQDAAGNISATPRTLNVVLDTTSPMISIGAPPNGARVKGLFTLSGSCEAGTNILVGGTGVVSQSTTCNSGVFSTLATLTAGETTKSLTVSQTDLAGNSSTVNLSVLRDDTAPAPSITSPAVSSSYQNSLTLSGICSQNTGDIQTISISSPGISGSPLTAVCSSGNFSQSIVLIGADGLRTLVISQLDEAGNGGTTSLGILKDTTAPVINLVSPTVNFRSQSGIVLSGTCEDGTINVGGDTTPTTTICSLGNFSQSILLSGTDGSKTITLSQTDAAGNVGTISRVFLKDTSAPDLNITSPSPSDRFQTAVAVSGTCEPAGQLDFTGSDITPVLNVTCPGSGIFSQIVNLSGVDGAKTFTVEHRDSLNNLTSEAVNVVKDNIAPTLTLTSPSALTNTQATLTLIGTCGTAPGDSTNITLESTSVDGAPLTLSCTAGTFSQLITLSGSDGTKALTLKKKDSANNESSIARSFVKDTTAPTLNITSPNSLASFQNTLTLTGTCETGLTVNIAGDVTATTTTCSGSSFSSSITLSATDGAKLITVSQTDTAGNTGSTTRTFYKDTTAPAITFSSPASGTNIQSMVAISGTCEAGLAISYSGDISSPSSTSCASGSFSDTVTLTAGQGSKTLTLSQTDSAGNIGSQSLAVTRDNTAPLITFTSPTANSSYQNSITVSGTCGALPTDLSSLILSGPFTGSPLALNCISGNFSSTVSLTGTDGLKTLSITQQDQAANSSTANLNLYKDTTAPALTVSSPASGFVTQGGFTVTGTCEAGVTIQITGDVVSSSMTCTAGSYATNLTLTGPDGSKNIQLSQTDPASNSFSLSLSIKKDTIPPTINTFQIANGASTVYLPSTNGTQSSSDTNGVTHYQISENNVVPTSWKPIASSFSVDLSAAPGEKSVYLWVKDAADNIATAVRNISLSYDSAPVPKFLSPLSPATVVANQNLTVSWQCNSNVSLDAAPYDLFYTTDNESLIPIVSNTSSTSINWSVPASIGSQAFRLVISCKNSAQIKSLAYSTPMNIGEWNIFLGDTGSQIEGVNLNNADVFNSVNNNKRSIVKTQQGHLFYTKDNSIMKVDGTTGNVSRFIGKHNTSGCTLTDGNGGLSQTLITPEIIGLDANENFFYVLSVSCNKIFRVNSDSAEVELWISGLNMHEGGQKKSRSFLTSTKHIIYSWNRKIYKLNVAVKNSTPTIIHGTNTCSATNASFGNVSALGLAIKGTANSSCTNVLVITSSAGDKIWLQANDSVSASPAVYKLEQSGGEYDYQISNESESIDWSKVRSYSCTSNDNTSILCAAGGSIFNFNTNTTAVSSVLSNYGLILNASNENSPSIDRLGNSFILQTLEGEFHTLQFNPTNSTYSTVRLGGRSRASFGNSSSTPPYSPIEFFSPTEIQYVSSVNRLFITNQASSVRFISFGSTTSDNWGVGSLFSYDLWHQTDGSNGGGYPNLTYKNYATINQNGGSFISKNDWCGIRYFSAVFNYVAGTLASNSNYLVHGNCTVGTPAVNMYPFASGIGASTRIFSNQIYPIQRMVFTSNQELIFGAIDHTNGSNPMLIKRTSDNKLVILGGQVGAASYDPSDEGGLLSDANFFKIYHLQALSNGDIIIWDGKLVRKATVATENPARIYNLMDISILDPSFDTKVGTGYLEDAWFDESTSSSYHLYPDKTIQRAKAGQAVKNYNMTGTTLPGRIRITGSPYGLLILEPNNRRVLRVDL